MSLVVSVDRFVFSLPDKFLKVDNLALASCLALELVDIRFKIT